MQLIKKVVIFLNTQSEKCLPLARKGAAFLASKGIECLSASEEFSEIPRADLKNPDVDMALAFGGDGTILGASKFLIDKNIPIMGINVGHLGYLAAAEIGEMDEALNALVEGRYFIEERITLDAELNGKKYRGLNEAVLDRGGQPHLLNIRVFINGQEADGLRADGIMAATPTGSTAYNLSAGGPLIVPSAENLVITPICAHSLGARPLVVAKNDVVTFYVSTRAESDPVLSLDGNTVGEVAQGESVTVTVGEGKLKLIRTDEHCFFKTLRKKLTFLQGV